MKKIDEVQTIPVLRIDVEPKKLKEFKKQFDAHQKWLRKMFMKSMFTPWERFKFWFWRIKI